MTDTSNLSAPLSTMEPMLRVLSLGAGVQSTCVALMTVHGDLPPIDAAIFSDTGWEPREVYDHLARLEIEMESHGVPVYRVSAGNIRDDHLNPQSPHLFIRNPVKHPEWLGLQRTFIPFYVLTPEGKREVVLGDEVDGMAQPVLPGLGPEPEPESTEVTFRKGRTRRTCTKTYKIEPVEKKLRELLGLKPRQRWPLTPSVKQLFGISYDESQRMASPSQPCIVHDYPLVDLKMTRDDCHEWMALHGWTAPRSACIGCPFHRNDEWRRLRDDHPEEFAEAIEFDEVFRSRHAAGLMPLEGIPFLHDSRVPLREADLGDADGEGFGGACEGFCGT